MSNRVPEGKVMAISVGLGREIEGVAATVGGSAIPSRAPVADSLTRVSAPAWGPGAEFPVVGVCTVGSEAAEAGGINVLTKERVLLSQLRGQIVYLNFWATWCPPCKEEMPALDALSKELQGKVKFLAFDIDGTEDQALIARYAQDNGLSLPLIYDEGKAGRTYLVTGVPISIVIGRDGKITGKKLGAATREQMLDLIATAQK